MIDGLSPWQRAQFINSITQDQSWASLHTSGIEWAEPLANEISGPGYRRVPVDWQQSGSLLFNINALVWRGLEVPVGLFSVGIFTTAFGNVLRGRGLLPEPITLVEQTSFRLGRGELVLSIA
jgi:hypothetical protein